MKQTNAKEWSEILDRVTVLGNETAEHQVKASELAALLKYILFELIRKDPTNTNAIPHFFQYIDDPIEVLNATTPGSANTKLCIAGLARHGWRVGFYDEANRKFYLRGLGGESLGFYYESIITCNGTNYVISSDHSQLIDLNA